MDDQPSPVKPDDPLSESLSTSKENLTPSPTPTPPLVQPQVAQPLQNPTFSPPKQTPTFVSQADQTSPPVRRSKRKFLIPLVLIIIIILAAVAVFVFKGSTGTTKPSGSTKLSYLSKNYSIGISDNNSINVTNPYSLGISFNDSWNPKPTCPSKQPGFAGKITPTNMTDASATFTITQNKKPYTPTSNSATPICGTGTAVVPPDGTSYNFSSAWLENGPAFKTLTINGKSYTLHVDQTDYTLTISNGPITDGVLFFPESIGTLYSDPPSCMSVTQLQAYAQQNGMELATTKYPGIEQSAPVVDSGTVQFVNPSNQQILVTINNNYIKLAQQTSQKETCQIWAQSGTVSGIVGNHMGSITVGSDNGSAIY